MRIIIHSTQPYDPFFDIDPDADMSEYGSRLCFISEGLRNVE